MTLVIFLYFSHVFLKMILHFLVLQLLLCGSNKIHQKQQLMLSQRNTFPMCFPDVSIWVSKRHLKLYFEIKGTSKKNKLTLFHQSPFFTKSVTLCLRSVSTDKAEVLSFPLPHPNTPSTVLYTQATVSFSAITIISGYCVLEVVSALRMSSCVRDLVPRVVMLTDD